jgi:hypothetical protein
VQAVQNADDELTRTLPPARETAADVRDIAWQIEDAAGEPAGPAARHAASGQRAADFPCYRHRLRPFLTNPDLALAFNQAAGPRYREKIRYQRARKPLRNRC